MMRSLSALLIVKGLAVLLLIFSVAPALFAEKIYTYIDNNGNQIISTTPPPAGISIYASEILVNSNNIASVEARALDSTSLYQYVDKNGVVHYTSIPREGAKKIADVNNDGPQDFSTYPSSDSFLDGLDFDPDFTDDFADGYIDDLGDFVSKFSYQDTLDRQYSYSAKAQKYDSLIQKYAALNNLDPVLLHAVIRAESGYNPNSISSAGAAGLMQLMPATAERFGVTDRLDPEQSIRGGSTYLKQLIKLFNGNIMLVLAGYNAGEGTIISKDFRIPNYPETRNYVLKIMEYYFRHKTSKNNPF